MVTWTSAAPCVAVALAAVLVPGLAVATAARLRGVAALGVSGPLGYAVLGAAGVLAAALRVPFGVGAVLATTAVAVVVIVALRLLLRALGRPLPAWDTWRPAAWVPTAAAAAVATAVVAAVAFAHVPDPDRISQTYDAVFHLNAAASILQSGDASSLHLYRLTHPGKSLAYYPAVWHSITALVAQLTGVPIPVAANATWLGTAAPVFALGSAFAAAVLLGSAGLRRDDAAPEQRALVAAVAALAASMFVAFPYLLLDFGTLYPNGLAYTTLPVGLALAAALLRYPAGAAWRPEHPASSGRTLLLGGGWLVGGAFAHPRSLVALVVLTVPMLVGWFAARMRATAAAGPTGRRRARLGWALLLTGALGAAVLAAGAVYVYYDVATRPIADHLNGGPAQATETLPQGLLQGLLATSLSAGGSPLPPSLLLAVVAFAGLLAAVVRPGLRWLLVTYLTVVVLYGLAAGSDSDVAKVATGLWDKDKFRILAMLPTIGVPLVAWTIVAGAAEVANTFRGRVARRADPRARTVVAVVTVATAVLGAVTWTGPALGGVSSAIGGVFALPDSRKQGLLVDADEVALLRRVGEFVPADAVIAGNPWNGSALAWALGGRRTLFPHLGGYWGDDRNVIRLHLDDYRTDPRVCPAVRAVGLHWLLTDDGRLSGDRHAFRRFQALDRTASTPGVRLVASSGSARLWRFTGCWG